MPQSLFKQFQQQGILDEVVRYAELHGYISTSIKYDHDPLAIRKALLQATGDPEFGRVAILKNGSGPEDVVSLLVDTFTDRLLQREKKIEVLEIQLRDALTRVDYYKTIGETRITDKLKGFLVK